ncbi:DinB family protein [Streptomyces sp. PT12]|uniref:DinB family protein n=1 Tax=Streptomyces sp. PT12 TaxID=1510197 RepID=UPI0015EFCCC7|nr:DinB family protein [Streptomyces sp. PT12]
MDETKPKADLRRYLQEARDTLLWKLDGLSEYDIRRPMTGTGTNLLGLVKHMAANEIGYFGWTFGRKFGRELAEELPWISADAEPNADLWATAEESREDIVGLYRRVWAHADATIEELPLDAPGHVPHWTRHEVTLHQILLHVTAETHRHAGHADIVRELIDGAVGLRSNGDNMPEVDADWWEGYRARLDEVARTAGGPAHRGGPHRGGPHRGTGPVEPSRRVSS